MAVAYRPVQWNRNKWIYDAILVLSVAGYILVYTRVAPLVREGPPLDTATLRMRAYGSCAFLMLTLILAIGPLARLDRRFLPVLYNRRHFGVMTCVVAGAHLGYVLGWFHAFAPVDRGSRSCRATPPSARSPASRSRRWACWRSPSCW